MITVIASSRRPAKPDPYCSRDRAHAMRSRYVRRIMRLLGRALYRKLVCAARVFMDTPRPREGSAV